MNRSTKWTGLLVGIAQLVAVEAAHASVTFGDTPVGSTSSSFTADGFLFSTSAPNLGATHLITSASYGASNGTQFLAYYAFDNQETFSMAGNTPFALNSIDLGGWAHFGQDPQTLSVTGYQAGGHTITTQLSISPTSFQTYALSGFTNLQSVQLGNLSRGYVAVDNIMTTPVPEPESYALMLAGLGLLGFLGRRRKLQQATA